MIIFNVRCEVLEEIEVRDSTGNAVRVRPGHYKLLGLEHLVLNSTGQMRETGMDLSIVDEMSHATVCTLNAETLATLMCKDDLEVEI
ncbi:MAG: hypothetical protein ACTSQV_00740 [Alphaproteobacteria bacterium]